VHFLFSSPECNAISAVYEGLALEHPEIVFLKVDIYEMPEIRTLVPGWMVPSFYFRREGNDLGTVTGPDEAGLRRAIANGGRVGGICSECNLQ